MYGSNIRYDNYKSCKDVLADIRNRKVDNITHNLTSQSLFIKSLWKESTTYGTQIWQNTTKIFQKTYSVLLIVISVTRYQHQSTWSCGESLK